MTDKPVRDAGFTLVAVLFMLLLAMSLSIYLCVVLANQSTMTGSLESQLYSLILAENGIEYARTLLPHVDISELLQGPDGSHSGTGRTEWRNPLPFDLARKLELESWSVSCDDGWPAYNHALLLDHGYAAAGGGRFYLRFSNNPGEAATDDRDGVVLVRSMGIASAKRSGIFGGVRNNVTLVEAVLRQENVFDLPAALVLFGDAGMFEWASHGFELDGGTKPAVGVVGGPELIANLLNSLDPGDIARVKGAGETPSVRDLTADGMTSPVYRRIFEAEFWAHFRDQLPGFTDTREPGIHFYPDGGGITGPFEGFLVARGDFTITGSTVEGVVLHLGGGRLTLGADTTVRGSIWMSNNSSDAQGNILHQPLDLKVLSSVTVVYDPVAVRRSLTLLPPTQLGWRILFPEMKL